MFTKDIIWGVLSIYDILLMFFIYSFFGWCVEVIHATLKTGKFVNRGFLNGIVCPIYGVGLCLVISLLKPFEESILLLFIASAILTTLIEFVVGFVLEKLFKLKWWDYGKEHFNIKGYVCLKYSLLWGLACVFVIKAVQTQIMKVINFLPIVVGIVLICVFSAIIITDFILTILQLKKYNERIKELGELSEKFRAVSDNLGEKISSLTLKIENSRLIKAFPNLKEKIMRKKVKKDIEEDNEDIEKAEEGEKK